MNDQPKRRGRPPKVRPIETMPVELKDPTDFGTCDVPDCGKDSTEENLTTGAETCEDHHDFAVSVAAGGDYPEAPLTLPQIIALDRDHDGNPGGSWPHASLTENETRGLIAEFFDAYESQIETKRVDTFNRVWTFRHEAIHSQDTMVLHVKRGPVTAERHVPASMARFTDVGVLLAELDGETTR